MASKNDLNTLFVIEMVNTVDIGRLEAELLRRNGSILKILCSHADNFGVGFKHAGDIFIGRLDQSSYKEEVLAAWKTRDWRWFVNSRDNRGLPGWVSEMLRALDLRPSAYQERNAQRRVRTTL